MTIYKRAFILVLATGLCLIPLTTLAAGNPIMVQRPTPPPVHRFLDGQNICLHSINAIIMAADIASTHNALQAPGTRELNPLAQSQGGMIALKVAAVGAGLGIAYMLHKSGHHKAERVIPLIFGVPSGIAAAHNAGIHQ
jgi:hypothetical protein